MSNVGYARSKRDEERQRTEFKDRRDSCIALNMEGRRFRQALKNCLFEGVDKRGVELDEARQAFYEPVW
jgi:hypothetical protein